MPPHKTTPPANMDAPLLRFAGVTLRVAGRDVFHDTFWTVRRGEQWAVVGANGSGKSLLLQAVLGDIPVSRGEIEYGLDEGPGAAPREWYPDNRIALVSLRQHREVMGDAMAFYQARWSPVDDSEPMLLRDFLLAGTAPSPKSLFGRILGFFDLAPLVKRSITSLSNGEMRKALIARALLSKPRVLLLDDPFSGMDKDSRSRLKRILKTLMSEGLSIILATSRLEEIPPGITHVLLVEGARVSQQGRRRAMLAGAPVRALALPPPAVPAPALRFYRRTRDGSGIRPGAPLAELRNVGVRYGRTAILRGVTWTIRPGERWLLRGPNGSGKSTLISLLVGDNPQAYANDIRLFGMQRGHGESIWEIKEHLGWMGPELQFLYPGDATCFEVVCSGLYDTVGLYRECSRRERRAVGCWLENVGMVHLAGEPFGALTDSGQRLVLLARAMVKEPPLVVLDEPCQGLDGGHRATVLSVVDAIAGQSGAAVVYVTHHSDEIPPAFTHELSLNAGRVVRCGLR